MHICVGLVVCLSRGLQERCERITVEREYIVCCFTGKDLHVIPLVLNNRIAFYRPIFQIRVKLSMIEC